jgi:tetratricopeptide (TPR) repeat protein
VVELRETAAEDREIITWRYGRCLPYGDGVTFWALGEIVKAQCGIHENDAADVASKKVRRAVAGLVVEAERSWVERSVRPLVGLALDDVALQDRRVELFAGWRMFLEGLAEQRPVVVVIDDLQWADDGLLDFVDGLVDLVEGVPLLVVGCARPELLERRPEWGGGKRNALTISLGSLSSGDTARLAESLLGRDPADDDLRATVVERSAGNPLYVEELVRMQTSGGATAGLPDSVLGIVTARVDLLPATEKELLRDAAVMGGVVWSDGLRAVSERPDEEVERLLRSLGRKEFLRRERHSAVAGATQHAFVHTLVRDAVYAQLARPDRVDRHLRVARWIESLPDDRREDRAELLAHHYLEAIDLARASGLDVAELEPKAATALREAGLRAFAIGAFPASARALHAATALMVGGLDPHALRALGKALILTEQAGEVELRDAFEGLVVSGARAEAGAVAVDLAEAGWLHGDGAGAAEWTARALELVSDTGPSREHAYVLAMAARFEMVRGRSEESSSIADRAIALAEAVDAQGARVSALITKATAQANRGDYVHVRDDLEEARQLALEHELREVARADANLSSILLELGDLEGSTSAARAGVAHAERLGVSGGAGGFVYGNLADACFLTGTWDEAEAIAEAELERAEKAGGLYYEPFFRFVLMELRLVRHGDVDQAVRDARELVELGYSRGDDQIVLPFLALAAWMLVHAGRAEEAGSLLDELLEHRRANPRGTIPGYWIAFAALGLEGLGRSGSLAGLDEPPGSRFLEAALAIDARRFDDAAETFREIGAPQLEAETRVLAASEMRAAGDDDGADRELARARELLQGLGATARLRELEEPL